MLTFWYWLFKDALFFFGIVSGRDGFPRPLSCQEEQEAAADAFFTAGRGIHPVKGARSPEYRIKCMLCAAQREAARGMLLYISFLSA